MVAIDTNIVVRILTNDDPPQVARARRLLQGETAWIGLAVLMETEWVLRMIRHVAEPSICTTPASISPTRYIWPWPTVTHPALRHSMRTSSTRPRDAGSRFRS